jgi:hypothetical protein
MPRRCRPQTSLFTRRSTSSADARNFSHPGHGGTVVVVHSGAPKYDTKSKPAILFGRSCGCSGAHLNNEFLPMTRCPPAGTLSFRMVTSEFVHPLLISVTRGPRNKHLTSSNGNSYFASKVREKEKSMPCRSWSAGSSASLGHGLLVRLGDSFP